MVPFTNTKEKRNKLKSLARQVGTVEFSSLIKNQETS